MAITKQVYTITSTWTYSQLADLFRTAFIDAGLMASWYDSFLVGNTENRVLEITYNAGKTYGKTYYWFQFYQSGSRIELSVCTGWNATTHLPVGTLYLDYASTSTTAMAGDYMISGLSMSTAFSLTRFTSQIDSTHTWFRIKHGSTYETFTIASPTHQPASWIDLNKDLFHHYLKVNTQVPNLSAILSFTSICSIRRSYGLGSALNGDTSHRIFYLNVASYGATGRAGAGNYVNNVSSIATHNGFPSVGSVVVLPNGNSTANPAYSSNYNPVVTGVPYSFYVTNSTLPADFGIIPHYTNNTLAPEDTFVVTSGTEEWEILKSVNSSQAVNGCSIAFAARIV